MRKKREKKIVFGNLNASKLSSASLLYIIAARQIPRVNSLYRVKTPVSFPERKWTTMEQKNAIKSKDSWDFFFLYELLWLSKSLAKSNVNLSGWKKGELSVREFANLSDHNWFVSNEKGWGKWKYQLGLLTLSGNFATWLSAHQKLQPFVMIVYLVN